MARSLRIRFLALIALLSTLTQMSAVTILLPPDASPLETLAGREIQRYVFLRTGELLPIQAAGQAHRGKTILVARKDRPTVAGAARQAAWLSASADLGPQEYRLKTQPASGTAQTLWIIGGDDLGTLYGAYAFAERLGARFYLDGDVLPSRRIKLELSGYDVRAQPLFPLRGLVPFHDFPEGPDWWTADEWEAVLAQATKMRLNFVGLHTYPKGALGPEPTVWIGLPQDVNADGTVKLSDATSWHNTQRFAEYGCYRPERTGDFHFGGAQLFESDNFGPEVNGPEDFPFPQTPEARVALMNRTGAMLRDVFSYAHAHGIKTCVGTEGPLNIPEVIKSRLAEAGLNPTNSATVQQLYEGMFTRIQRTFPIDYYWIWGHEGEINQGVFLDDLRGAVAAAEATRPPFGLAICGWGWITDNFRAIHQALPQDIAFSAINLSVGNAPVSTNFAQLAPRSRWAIPWFEDDPALITPQLWVGRTRKDAADALAYGCNGLMGLHWRTRVLGPNISALAQAAWDQSCWHPLPSQSSATNSPHTSQDPKAATDPKQAARSLPALDFYQDWAAAQFGHGPAEACARLFASLDGRFPRPCDWNRGPGVITVNRQPWEKVKSQYQFVDEFSRLRPQVRGAAERERFDWWLNSFRYTAAMAHLGCARAELNRLMTELWNQSDPALKRQSARAQALPLRLQLVTLLEEMYRHLLATVHNTSELGMLVNVEQQSLLRTRLLTAHDDMLRDMLGEELPAQAYPGKKYRGPLRIIVPTRRPSLPAGDSLKLKVIILAEEQPKEAVACCRPLGQGRFSRLPLTHVARGVYGVVLPPATPQGLEYYVQVTDTHGNLVRYPSSAPSLNLTAVAEMPR